MRKILILYILLLILFSCKTAENTEFPKWINELSANASKTLQTQVNVTHINLPDNLREGKYFVFSLKGAGSLEKVKDPFETINKMFLSDGWTYVAEYQADGHGSSSFGYEKGNYFCNIYVNIDSSDDDRENHTPSKFWIEIYCREK
jgi:hypothetical protein